MKISGLLYKTKKMYIASCQRLGVIIKNPSENMQKYKLLFIGVFLLNFGLVELASAGGPGGGIGGGGGANFTVQNQQFLAVICAITGFIEGAFGALIMIISGLGAIVSAAFGQYKAAIGMLVVAIGAFVLRALVRTFFGNVYDQGCTVTAIAR